MKLKSFWSLLLILAAASGLRGAESNSAPTMSRIEANELFNSLVTIEAGLTPANTIAAADAINTLRPIVEALEKGRAALRKQFNGQKVDDPAVIAAVEAFELKAAEQIQVTLPKLTLSPEEISAAKVKPAVLSVLRRYLK